MNALLEQIKNGLRETIVMSIVALCLFTLLALMSYHPADPGWSHATNVTQSLHNLAGGIGAWLADVLLYFFGYAAYLLPFLLSFLVQDIRPLPRVTFGERILKLIGATLLCVSVSVLATIYVWKQGAGSLPYGAGGVLGYSLTFDLYQRLLPQGIYLLVLGLSAMGLVLLTGAACLQLVEWIGEKILKVIGKLIFWRRNKSPVTETVSVNVEPEIVSMPNIAITTTKIERREPTVGFLEQATSVMPAAMHSTPIFDAPIQQKQMPPPAAMKETPEELMILSQTLTGSYQVPPLNLLDLPAPKPAQIISTQALTEMSRNVELRLKDFGIDVNVVAAYPGPVITRYELQLAPGLKVSRIASLAKDLARSLSVISVRIVEVIPGKAVIGLEIPNPNRLMVNLREILSSAPYEQTRSPLCLALGCDIAGHPVIVNLGKMPHLLVAGTTGSGKSVGVNAMLLSLLYKATPQDVRFILIDPKMLELAIYEGIPHLLAPVVTDMKEAASALRWCVAEMERRYRLLAAVGVRHLAGFNAKIVEGMQNGKPILDPLTAANSLQPPKPLEPLPYIVVVIDEFADMMMVVGKKVEDLIARLAQKARAAGIHLILATQRPSVDVITGLIKANIPTRIAFQVSSKIDSRTILDQSGAEQLLGHGDMLYLAPGTGIPTRVHGAFVDDHEVHAVVNYLKQQAQPEYIDSILDDSGAVTVNGAGDEGQSVEEADSLYDEAVQFVLETKRPSISSLQRRFKVGFNRAARLMDEMERTGILGPMEANGNREILVNRGES